MKKKKYEKICKSCTTEFVTRWSTAHYCDRCNPNKREKFLTKEFPEKKCDHCATPFNPKTKVNRFCSFGCNRKYFGSRQYLKNDEKTNCGDGYLEIDFKVSRICNLCSREFEPKGKGRHLYCLACRERYPTTKPRQSENPCKQCGKPFTHMRPKVRFCSSKCSSTWTNANGHGPRHDDDALLGRFVAVISRHERCLSKEELIMESGSSAKAMDTRNWSMRSLYEHAGRSYDPPVLSSRFADRVYSVISEIVPDMEIEFDKPLPGMHGFKGGKLRADFFIRDLDLIVEADGKQHLTGRDDLDRLDYIRANDRLKDEYAEANGLTLIRIPETVDSRSIKARLLRGIRRARPRFRQHNPSNADSTSGSVRRMPTRRNVSDRPAKKRGEMGEPEPDIYCRGCHARPSFKNKGTYLCEKCWGKSHDLWLTSRVLQKNQVTEIRSKIEDYIRDKCRYVWQSEIYLYCCHFSITDLKKNGIVVAKICRSLGFFAPEDDGISRATVSRVKDFVSKYHGVHRKYPGVRTMMKELGIDHQTLWSYMDYNKFIEDLGGRAVSHVRFRYSSNDEFLHAAAQVVEAAGHPMPMTSIFEALGICYPAYLANFKLVRSEHIHDLAGVPRMTRKRREK